MLTLAGQVAIAIHNAQLYEEIKKQAAELEVSNKVKDEFLSIMSHELRTPLSVVTGYVGMVKDGMLGAVNPQQEEALKKVLTCASDQLSMINDIMQTTQLEAHATPVQREPVDLAELGKSLRDSYDLLLSKGSVKLVWNFPSAPAAVVTDGAKLKQILQNLINNALKFTHQGSVTISARLLSPLPPRAAAPLHGGGGAEGRGGMVELKVADTGIGIPLDKLDLVFDKFHQVDSSETRLYGGVGLGLYIVKQFTELLGGEISLESEGGKGTTFTVTLPCGQ